MTASDSLFRLIKALDTNEKRYFKLYSSLHKSRKQYLPLFDALENQVKFNEKELCKQLDKNLVRQLSFYKNYLYKLILKSLKQFHAGKTVDSEIRDLLDYIDILLNKKQYDECIKLLKRAKNLAKEYYRFSYSLEISELERKLKVVLRDVKWVMANQEKLFTEEDKLIEKIINLQQYRKLGVKTVLFHERYGEARSTADYKRYKELQRKAELQKINKALSPPAIMEFYYWNSVLHLLTQNSGKSIRDTLRLKDIIKENKALQKAYPREFLRAEYNAMKGQIQTTGFWNALQLLNKFHSQYYPYPVQQEDVEIRYYIDVLHTHIRFGKFKESINWINDTEIWLIKARKKIHKHLLNTFYGYAAVLFFGISEYKKSLVYLNRVLNNYTKYDHQAFHCSLLVFNLILHYEMGNQDLLEHMARTTYRTLNKKKKLYKTETIVLNFIKQGILTKPSDEKQLQVFKQTKGKLEEIANDSYENKAYLSFSFDFVAWLESKIKNISFAELVKKE